MTVWEKSRGERRRLGEGDSWDDNRVAMIGEWARIGYRVQEWDIASGLRRSSPKD